MSLFKKVGGPVLLLFLAFAPLATADTLTSLMGWPFGDEYGIGLTYATRPALSENPIPRYINNIVYPVLGLPAIVERGDTLRVAVYYDGDTDFSDPALWRVTLHSGFANPLTSFTSVGDAVIQQYNLPVLEVTFDSLTWMYQLTCQVSESIPEDVFSLEVKNYQIDDYQPAAVAIKDLIGDNFLFVHMADAQMDDPRGSDTDNQVNSFSYPMAYEGSSAEAILRQELLQEISLLRPDFVLFSGDLGYGVDSIADVLKFLTIAQSCQVPVFMVPGNHDGMAHTPDSQLLRDGLEFYARGFGPLYYSFDYGSLHFVGMNSYDGSTERRQAGNLFIASPVSNWGGELSDVQLRWLKKDLEQATQAGQTNLLFMHHDPRGPYRANNPYPEQSLGIEEQFWNFDSADWDSNPTDSIFNETRHSNTGVYLLKFALANNATHLFMGHSHWDEIWNYEPGEPLLDRDGAAVGDIILTDPFSVVMTTTCSSGIDEQPDQRDYDGYRVVEVNGGQITSTNAIFPDLPSRSVPAGNLWMETINNDGHSTRAQATIVNALPADFPVTAEFYLPGIPQGYEILDETTQAAQHFTDLGLGIDGQIVVYLRVTARGTFMPDGQFPPPAGTEMRTYLTARPHPTNQAPVASFTVAPELEEKDTFTFDAGASADPEGGALLYFWNFGDGDTATGAIVTHFFPNGHRATVKLTVVDPVGGQASSLTTLDMIPKTDDDGDDDSGCGCSVTSRRPADPFFLTMLAALLGVLALRAFCAARSSR